MNNPYFDRPAMNVNSIYEAIADLKESIAILNDLVIGDDFFLFL